MPIVSMFYGIIVYMYFLDNQRHNAAHVHVEYQGQEAVVAIPSGDVLEGAIPPNKLRLVQAWIEIHGEELVADWTLAARGESIFRIEPLR